MSASDILLSLTTAMVAATAMSFLLGDAHPILTELKMKVPAPKQVGDTSLPPRSVKWLGAIVLAGALLICLFA